LTGLGGTEGGAGADMFVERIVVQKSCKLLNKTEVKVLSRRWSLKNVCRRTYLAVWDAVWWWWWWDMSSKTYRYHGMSSTMDMREVEAPDVQYW